MDNKVLYFFEELSKIPRASGNEKAVANWLVDFAKEHGLKYYVDNFNNVLIKKGDKKHSPLMLQAHTDMVCIKDEDYDFDFSKDPIKLVYEGDYLKAHKTSLGADNGLGVAIILSLLDANNNYDIEALFTSDEEVTMTGAINFDYSKLNAKTAISLDGFSDEEIITGCASICDMKINTTFSKTEKEVDGYKLVISGLKGGHSGNQIDKNLGNAIKLTAEFLEKLDNLEIQSFVGGKQFNFIPNQTLTTFSCKNSLNEVTEILNNFTIEKKKEYPALKVELKLTKLNSTIGFKDSLSLISLINNIKTGVLEKNELGILLSQNLACVDTDENIIKISHRGHNLTLEDNNIIYLQDLAQKFGFGFEIFDKQKGFSTDINSSLVEKAKNGFSKLYNITPNVCTKHISLEGGIFADNIDDFEFIVLSPKIMDVHSTSEKVYIPSIAKTYSIITSILDEM